MFGWRIVLLGRPGSDGRALHLSVGWIVLVLLAVALLVGLGALGLLSIGSVAGSWLHDATSLP